jgi:hypothetical protein
MKYKLSKAIQVDGISITEIDVNFENLTTMDYEHADREFKATNQPLSNGMVEAETVFIKSILVRAANLTVSAIDQLPINDFASLKVRAQNFLLDGIKALSMGLEKHV